MTDIAEETDSEHYLLQAKVRTPEMEMSVLGADVAEAADLDIAEINPANPHLFREDRWQEHFALLRNEDPVHFNELETA